MAKSVYSIVLTDEVVQEVDEMAYRLGISRSNLIDRILAERVSFTTPEMRIRDIFSLVEKALGNSFPAAPQISGTVMAVRAPLRFKYKPTVKYSVELFRSFSGCVGRLKVGLRTQSAELSRLTEGFFNVWKGLEEKYCGELFRGKLPAEISQNCYVRDLYEIGEGELDDREIAEAISDYIRVFDKAIKLYFDNAEDSDAAAEQTERIYKEYLKNGVRII